MAKAKGFTYNLGERVAFRGCGPILTDEDASNIGVIMKRISKKSGQRHWYEVAFPKGHIGLVEEFELRRAPVPRPCPDDDTRWFRDTDDATRWFRDTE